MHNVRLRATILIVLPALSMSIPALVRLAIPVPPSPEAFILSIAAEYLSVSSVICAWVWIFVDTYQRAGRHRRQLLWLLVLIPFLLCYPAWLVLAFIGMSFGGPPF